MSRPLEPTRGAIHNVARLKAMDLGPCYVIAVSETTLNIIQNYAIDEVGYLSRYGVSFEGGYYTPVDEDHSDYGFVLDVIRRYKLEVNDLTCDLVEALNNITTVMEAMVSCCQTRELSGQQIDDISHDGTVSVGQPGDDFPDQSSYFGAKCNVANAIYDQIKGQFDWFTSHYADLVLGELGGVTAAVTAGFLLAGPVGWGVIAVEALFVSMVVYLINENINFGDVNAALADTHDETVQALYNSGSAAVAKANFIAALEAGSPSITAIESDGVSLMLTSKLINQLFDPRADLVSYTSPDPVDCGTTLQVWTFPTDGQSWAFRDDSTGGNSASGVHVPAREAWGLTMDTSGGSGAAWGVIWIASLSIAVDVGNSVQFDHSAPSDDENSSRLLKVVYSDLSEYEVFSDGVAAGTITLDITVAGTIERIECMFGRQYNPLSPYTQDVEEVRVQ